MGKISVKEIKAIMLVHEKADYSDKAKLKALYDICVQRQMFSSKTGLKFQQAMLDIAEGRTTKDTCIFCHGHITDGKGVVCDECIARLNSVVEEKKKEIAEAKKRQAEAQLQKKAEEDRIRAEELAREEEEARREAERKQTEAELLAQAMQPSEEAEEVYGEQQPEEAKVPKEAEESETAEEHEAAEEPAQKEFTYVPFDFKRDEQEPEETLKDKLSKQKPALFTVLGVLTVIIIMIIYIFAGKKIVANTTSDRGVELNYYMGKEYSLLQTALGKSQAIVGDNIRYFKDACVSVIYDEITGIVSYLDLDGDGSPKTSILGVFPGMTKDAADSMLKTQNINKEDKCEGEIYSYYIPYPEDDKYRLQLDVSYINDKVAMVSIQITRNDQ